MVQYIPPPEPRSLLAPLLACLPTAFVSPRPPPALLPLLSPILRQRVQLLSLNSSSSSESWLPLLCWDPESARQLVDWVSESEAFELHPISGEIEIGSVEPVKYRRLDEETLQARIAAPETGLTIIVLWVETSEEGEGNAWRIAEVKPLDDLDDVRPGHWSSSMTAANEQAHQQVIEDAIREQEPRPPPSNGAIGTSTATTDDDNYWSSYDKAPAETPGASQIEDTSTRPRDSPEAGYFQRYAQVQPEMDHDDPSVDRGAIGESTLDGNNVLPPSVRFDSRPELGDPLSNISTFSSQNRPLTHTASTPPTSVPTAVLRLEQQADALSLSSLAIRQHVNTSIKSLFTLCRSSGMSRLEFERMVQVELLSLRVADEQGNGGR